MKLKPREKKCEFSGSACIIYDYASSRTRLMHAKIDTYIFSPFLRCPFFFFCDRISDARSFVEKYASIPRLPLHAAGTLLFFPSFHIFTERRSFFKNLGPIWLGKIFVECNFFKKYRIPRNKVKTRAILGFGWSKHRKINRWTKTPTSTKVAPNFVSIWSRARAFKISPRARRWENDVSPRVGKLCAQKQET